MVGAVVVGSEGCLSTRLRHRPLRLRFGFSVVAAAVAVAVAVAVVDSWRRYPTSALGGSSPAFLKHLQIG